MFRMNYLYPYISFQSMRRFLIDIAIELPVLLLIMYALTMRFDGKLFIAAFAGSMIAAGVRLLFNSFRDRKKKSAHRRSSDI